MTTLPQEIEEALNRLLVEQSYLTDAENAAGQSDRRWLAALARRDAQRDTLRSLLASLAADGARWRYVLDHAFVGADEDGNLLIVATLFDGSELDAALPGYAATPQLVKDHMMEADGFTGDPERMTALLDAARATP